MMLTDFHYIFKILSVFSFKRMPFSYAITIYIFIWKFFEATFHL